MFVCLIQSFGYFNEKFRGKKNKKSDAGLYYLLCD